jgi:hypothetical protein
MYPQSYYIGLQTSRGADGKWKHTTLTISQKIEIIMRLESGLMSLSQQTKETSK